MKMAFWEKIHIKALAFFAIFATLIVISWFRHGFVYGGGDVGLTTYNPKRIAEVISKVWWEDTAPGFPRPQGLPSLPVELALSVLQNLGFPPFAIQAVLFGMILFAMGMGMYFLVLDVVGKDKKVTACLASLFYLVNPYMMVQVWHRFIHSTFFLAAALPFLLLFWKRWIERRSFKSLAFFIIFNFLFSFMFSTLAYVLTVWGLLFYSVLFEAFVPWKGRKKLLSVTGKFLFGFILWVLTNIWWIMPVLLISPSLLSVQNSMLSSILTLVAISKQAIIPYSLAGLNPFYLFYNKELGDVFSSPLFLSIPWIYITVIFLGIYSSVKKRSLIFFTGLFLIAIFFAKGIAMPFGAPFLLGFTKLFIIGVLRNPFEKVGILIPFSGSILFAVGFINSWNFFNRKKFIPGKGILLFTFLLIFAVYHWPFWSGKLFGTLDKPSFVEIPSYYNEANDWIKNQHKAGNILHLPVLVAEGLSYRWQYGYSGVDSSTDFFTSNPSISMGFNLFYIDNALNSLDLMTDVTPQEEEKIKSLLRIFNVRFLVLHYDTDWQKSQTKDPAKVEEKLDKLSFLTKQGTFGSLIVYELKDSDYLPKLYIIDGVDYLVGFNADNPSFKSAWSWYARADTTKLAILDDNLAQSGISNDNSIVVLPKKVISFSSPKELNADDAVKLLPSVRVLPDSLFYNFIRIKERIQLLELKNTLTNLELLFAGKRLAEAYYLNKEKPNVSVSPIIKDYIKILPLAMDKLDKITKATAAKKEVPSGIKELINTHSTILKVLQDQVQRQDKNVLLEADNLLTKFKTGQGISTVYKQDAFGVDNTARQVFSYVVPFPGQYELLVADSNAEVLYKDRLETLGFQINGIKEERKLDKKSSFLSYGFTTLNKGEYEISYPKINSENLFRGFPDGKEELEITSAKNESKSVELKVEPYQSGGTYVLFFDFWVKKGNDPIIRVVQDDDSVDQRIAEDLYNKEWRKFVLPLDSRENSYQLSFQVEASPWDDCQKQLISNQKLCQNKDIKRNYQRPTTIVIKNVKIYRVFSNPLFLRLKNEASSAAKVANVSYSRPKSLVYEGSLQIDKPAYLVFAETFDKGWDLSLSNGQETIRPDIHVLANMYANAWYVDEPGNYKFKLEYKSQRYFNIGIYIGIFSFFTLLVITSFSYFRKKAL